ncbi:MAG: alpha/beta hydrolase, partial [Candidatus Marinimicrobia bacterium]|nr:alpha/beta hydrolase [Candidatus Neomarinimicrobiota bacterium]
MRFSLGILSVLAPPIAVRIADKLFFTPMGLPRPASEMPYYESASHSTMEYDGKKVAVYSWGEGEETLILVHGWASRGTRLGHLAEPLNKKGYRVISFDMPAHGDSEGK